MYSRFGDSYDAQLLELPHRPFRNCRLNIDAKRNARYSLKISLSLVILTNAFRIQK